MSEEADRRADFKEADDVRRAALLAAQADVFDQLKSRDNEDPGRRDYNDGLMMAARVLQDRIGERDRLEEELDCFCVALDSWFRDNATRERVDQEVRRDWEVRDAMDVRWREALASGNALAVVEVAFLAWTHGMRLPVAAPAVGHPA